MSSRRYRTRCVRLLLLLLLLAALTAGCSPPVGDPVTDAAPSRAPSSLSIAPSGDRTTASPDTRALRVLRRWDADRAAALTRRDRRALRSLYAPGTGLARADIELLAGYARRGLRLTAVRHQVVDAEVMLSGAGVVEISVVERLASVRVADDGGRERSLPTSPFERRRLRFERVGGVWRLSSARED